MKLARIFALTVLASILPALASAATATIAWTAPAVAVDGSALTGAQALTSYQVWLSTATIPSNTTTAPIATVTAANTTTTQTITAAPGATLYARVKACNSAGCSDFSTEASFKVPVSAPSVPTSVTVTINLTP
jgi:hypothetical protein